MARSVDVPRCGMPVSRLDRRGKLFQDACRNPLRRGARRCHLHADLFKWAALERKVREKARAKRQAKARRWSLTRLAKLSETRQLDLFVWADARAMVEKQAVDAYLADAMSRPERAPYPGIDAPRDVRDRWLDAYEAEERDSERRAEQLHRSFQDAWRAAERAVLEHGWPGWGTLRWLVYERDHGICFVCDRYVPFEVFELGHLQDRMMGGSDRPDNVVVMCLSCNRLSKPLHETPEQAREWAAICRARFREIWAYQPTEDDHARFMQRFGAMTDAERRALMDEALGWPEQVEAELSRLRGVSSDSGSTAADGG